MFFWNSLAFLMTQQMLAIWSLIRLPFSDPPWTSGSSRFTYCWSLTWRNFEHYFASVWDECNCAVVWAFFVIAFLWNWNETDLFQSCGHCWVFQICWHIECSTFTASSFRIWNSLTGIPSPLLALFVVIFLRPSWLHIPGYLALGEWSHHRDYLGHEDLFRTVLLCIVLVCNNCYYCCIFSHTNWAR